MLKINPQIKIALTALLLGIALIGATPPADASGVTVSNINFGKLLMNDGVDKEDLQGRVVGIEFWGINCAPCRAMMPHLNEWHKKYSPQGFVLMGFHSQDATDEAVTTFCKSVKVTFPIYAGGSVSGVSFTGIPHFTLFNHKGEMIFDGHPSEADGKLAAAMKDAPDPLLGEGPYKKLSALLPKIKDRKDLGTTLATLKNKYLNSENAEEKAEAEMLVERLTRFGTKMLERAETKKASEPKNAFELFQQAATLFKGDEIGDNAQKIVTELKADKDFQDNVKADKDLEEIVAGCEKLKACAKCSAFMKDCEACKKKNPSLEILMPKAKNLVKKYPSSPAAAKVKELLPVE